MLCLVGNLHFFFRESIPEVSFDGTGERGSLGSESAPLLPKSPRAPAGGQGHSAAAMDHELVSNYFEGESSSNQRSTRRTYSSTTLEVANLIDSPMSTRQPPEFFHYLDSITGAEFFPNVFPGEVV